MNIRSLFKNNFINFKLIIILSVIMVNVYSSEVYQFGTMPKDTYKTTEYPAWKIFFETNQKIKNEEDLKLYKHMVENVFDKTNELSKKLSGKKRYEKIVEKYKILQEDIIKIIDGKNYTEVEKVRLQVNEKIKPLLGYLSERSNPSNPFFATVSEFSGANRLQQDGLTGRNVKVIAFERYNNTIKPNIKTGEEIKLEIQQIHGPSVYDIIRQVAPGANISLEEPPVEDPLAKFLAKSLGIEATNKFKKFEDLYGKFFLVNLSLLETKNIAADKTKIPNNIVEFMLAFFKEEDISTKIKKLIDESVQKSQPNEPAINDYRAETNKMLDENFIATFNKLKPLSKDLAYELIIELGSDPTIDLNKYNAFFWGMPVFNTLMNRLMESKKSIPKEFQPSGNIQLSKEEKEKFLFLIGYSIFTSDLDYYKKLWEKNPGLYSEVKENFPRALTIQGLGNSFNEPGDFVESNIPGWLQSVRKIEELPDPVIFSVNINRLNLAHGSSNIPGFEKYLEQYIPFPRSDRAIHYTISTLGSDVKTSLNESNDINFHADFTGTSLSAPATTGGAALIAELFKEFGYNESDIASKVQEAILFSANKEFFIPRDGIINDFREDKHTKNGMNDVVQCVDPATTIFVVKSKDLEEVKKLYLASLSPYQKASASESRSGIYFEETKDGIEIRHSSSLLPSDYKLIKKKEIPLEKLKNNQSPYIFMPAEIYGQGILDLRRAFFYAITMIDNDVNELLENGTYRWDQNETIKKFLESERLSVDLLRDIIKSKRQYSEEKRKSIMEEVKKTGRNIMIDKFKINNCFDRAHVFKKVMDTIYGKHVTSVSQRIRKQKSKIKIKPRS